MPLLLHRNVSKDAQDASRPKIHLSPLAGRGRERSERVRGVLHRLRPWRVPLTPTLSPQAGRGNSLRDRYRLRHLDTFAADPATVGDGLEPPMLRAASKAAP